MSVYATILQLQEKNALLRHQLFSPKSERSPENADSPQLAMFNEAEELVEEPAAEPAEAETEEVVAPVKRRGKRKPLPGNLPRIEVIHELPEHELTCKCAPAWSHSARGCSIASAVMPWVWGAVPADNRIAGAAVTRRRLLVTAP